MGLWAAYFLVKGYWDWRGSLRMGFWLNAAFLAAVLLPKPKAGAARLAWNAGLALAAFLLAWRDSYLPPLRAALSFAGAADGATLGFTVRFLAGALNPLALLVSAALVGLCALAERRRLRLWPVCVLVLAGSFVRDVREPKGSQAKTLFRFHEAESARRVSLPPAPAQPFDVVFLHVCSLSWDDLRASGAGEAGLLGPLDRVFTDFNSVTSYSAPAALRLSRALCGQSPHEDLYRPWPGECNLWDALRRGGFRVRAAMNHRGRSREFLAQLQRLAGLDETLDASRLPARALNFDDEPLYSDAEVLSLWLKAREGSRGPEALYYNTISLHGGVHQPSETTWWTRDRRKAYRAAAEKLAAELEGFYAGLAASKRRTAVFFLPEHGMALRGSAMQADELRDIPLPEITRVPFGVKLFGPAAAGRPQARDERPVSYLALAALLASYLERPPFGAADAPELPLTSFVAENEGAIVLKEEGRFSLAAKDGAWRPVPASR